MKRVFILRDDQIKRHAFAAIEEWIGRGVLLELSVKQHEVKRNLDQNSKLHAAIQDVAEQVQWAGEWLDVESWKRLFSAALHGQKVMPALDGTGFVVINKRTSRMTKAECSELIDFVVAFGTERGVRFGDEEEAA